MYQRLTEVIAHNYDFVIRALWRCVVRGPMDDAIPSGGNKKDKPRERLDEFLKDRFPGGIPPGNEPHQGEAPDKAPAEKTRRKTKKTLRKQ